MDFLQNPDRMRGREVQALLRGKVDPEVLKVLVSQAEMISTLKTEMGEVVKLLAQLAEVVGDMNAHADAIVEGARKKQKGALDG